MKRSSGTLIATDEIGGNIWGEKRAVPCQFFIVVGCVGRTLQNK